MFGDKSIGGHGAFQIAFSREPTRTDGRFGVTDVVIGIGIPHIDAEQHVDSVFLVGPEHFLQSELQSNGQNKCCGKAEKDRPSVAFSPPRNGPLGHRGPEKATDAQQDAPEDPSSSGFACPLVMHRTCPTQNGRDGDQQRTEHSDQHIARKPFPVEDQDQPGKHQHRSGIGLKQDQGCGQGDDGYRLDQ